MSDDDLYLCNLQDHFVQKNPLCEKVTSRRMQATFFEQLFFGQSANDHDFSLTYRVPNPYRLQNLNCIYSKFITFLNG